MARPPAGRQGRRADWGDIFGGFLAWQAENGGKPMSATEFGAVLRQVCEQAGIQVRRHGDRIYCLNRRVSWS